MVVYRQLTDIEADRIFQALADVTRRDILLQTLHQAQSISTLASSYDMSFAAVQKHVAALERAALVTKERRGREQIVHANGLTLASAIALLDQYEQLWIDRANQIADLLAIPEQGDVP